MREPTLVALVFGLILAEFGSWKWSSYGRKKRALEKRGIFLTAKVQSFERTGIERNRIPFVKIEIATTGVNSEKLSLTLHRTLDPLHAEHVQPGAPVRIRIDPEDHTNFVALLACDLPVNQRHLLRIDYQEVAPSSEHAISTHEEGKKRLAAQQARLKELNGSGASARARINKMESLKVGLNDGVGFLARVEVEVLPEGAPPFSADFDVAIAFERLGRYITGESIWVRYDKEDATRVTIDLVMLKGEASSKPDAPSLTVENS